MAFRPHTEKRARTSWSTIPRVAEIFEPWSRGREKPWSSPPREIKMWHFRFAILLAVPLVAANKKPSAEQQVPLDQYVQQVNQRSHQSSSASPGSLYT